MDIINVCRPLSKIPLFSSNQYKYKRVIPLVMKRFMSLNESSERMMQRKEYNDALPGIIKNLLTKSRISQHSAVEIWLKKILDHNLVGGNNSQGIVTMFTYNMLEKPENITEENQNLSKVLGWCLELLHSSSCIVDDIMDNSTTRRGAPCWYLMPNVGMGAVNDAILMNCCVTELLEMYFSRTPHLPHLLNIFHKAMLYISMGQYLDVLMSQKKDYNMYTLKQYNEIIFYKGCYNSYQVPIDLGMTLVTDVHKKINIETNPVYASIYLQLAKLFQFQNDYNDCYGEKNVTGKVGTDIEEGKCTWLSVTALQLCNESQRRRFLKYYGSEHQEHVAEIKALYNELNLPELYEQETAKIHDDIVHCVSALSTDTSTFFFKLLDLFLSGSVVWGNTKIYIDSTCSPLRNKK